jgi:hypothetical protein
MGNLKNISSSERVEWIAYLQSFQSPDGLFRDPLLKSELADKADWWGWRHLTSHVYLAFTALGGVPSVGPSWLEPIMTPNGLKRWLDSLDWDKGVADSSNVIMNWGGGLLYAADVYDDVHARQMANLLFDELDARLQGKSGLWGPERSRDYTPEIWRSLRVQAAYHLWLLYAYRKRNPPFIARAMSAVLATQNPAGGFGWGVHNPEHPYESSACEDIDSIDPLVRFGRLSTGEVHRVPAALRIARPWVLSNFDSEGGAVFCKQMRFEYGHPRMTTGPGEPNMFATWFRLLSIAFIDAGLGRGNEWKFIKAPGYQLSPL